MSRSYDKRTTTFSPEGRLYQVEYAMAAVDQGGTCLGIMTKDAVILAVEKKSSHKLLDDDPRLKSDKLFQISKECVCAVAGFTADANVLIEEIRLAAERYRFQYGSSIPLEQLVIQICNKMQFYTQLGGQRPFGVSLLFAGWDNRHGFQLYKCDPSGNYGGWKGICIGNNNNTAQSILKTDWNEDLELESGTKLAFKIMNKTLDVQKLTEDRFELGILKMENELPKFSYMKRQDKVDRCKVLAEEVEKQKKEAAAKLKEQQRKQKEAAEKEAQSSSK